MNLQKTPAEVAAFTFRLTGGKPNPEATAASFRAAASTMREHAAKAAVAKSGKFAGYTADEALAHAAEMDARAVSVPAELRKLMG